jgi:putative sterol carrier protein
MDISVRGVLARAAARGFDERLADVEGSYRFDVDGAGSFRVEVDHGKITVREDRGRSAADCVVACSEQDFLEIAGGERDLLTAFMQARVRIEGDWMLAVVLWRILPGKGGRRAEAAP